MLATVGANPAPTGRNSQVSTLSPDAPLERAPFRGKPLGKSGRGHQRGISQGPWSLDQSLR